MAEVYKGRTCGEMGAFDSANAFLEKAATGAKNQGLQHMLGLAYLEMGNISGMQANYPKALDYFLNSLSIAEQSNDLPNIATLNQNLGNVYDALAQYGNSVKYFETVLKIFKAAGNVHGVASNNMGLAMGYSRLKQFPRAISHAQKGIAAFEQMQDTQSVILGYITLGGVFLSMKQLDSAQKNLIRAEQYVKNSDPGLYPIGSLYNKLGELYTKIACLPASGQIAYVRAGPADKTHQTVLRIAEQYLDSAIKYETVANDQLEMLSTYSNLSTCRELAGNYKGALSAYVKYAEIKDSVYNSDNKETIRNIEDRSYARYLARGGTANAAR